MEKEEKIAFFKSELDLIKTSEMRRLFTELISNVEDKFFIEPASSSGKYHPDFARLKHGLVYHTRAVIYFVNCLFETHCFCEQEDTKEALIVAALAHDIKKYGPDNSKTHTTKEHPLYGAEYAEKIIEQYQINIEERLKNIIVNSIKSHMGRWDSNLPHPTTKPEILLHISDYIASRKELDLSFLGKDKEDVPYKEEVVVPDNPGDFVMNFGKYNGKTLSEIVTINKQYITWLKENVKEGNEVLLECLKKL